MPDQLPKISQQQVVRFWLSQQGLLDCSRPRTLTAATFVEELERLGGLQVDSVNVLDRAHYLTLWSRFGNYDRAKVDSWLYQDRLAYEYWGHEASILPISHLPLGKRRMKRFPPKRWENAAYWSRYETSPESKRRVLKLIRQNGSLESADFEPTAKDKSNRSLLGWGSVIPKEDKRSLGLLWHAGKLAIDSRVSFRKQFDLAERVYPAEVKAASLKDYHDSWLRIGLRGNGFASESHLKNYWTAPSLNAEERREVIQRNLRKKAIVAVQVEGCKETYYVLPEHLEAPALPAPTGTIFICPFDSLLWQRQRAEDLLGFRYRIEIYVPESKRQFGYYVLPTLHNGVFAGRFDAKLHRDESRLEVKAVFLEKSFKASAEFKRDVKQRFSQFAEFLGADKLQLPAVSKWIRRSG